MSDHEEGSGGESFEFASPAERQVAGGRMNPSTAIVFFEYRDLSDPYGDHGCTGDACVGRAFFAFDPTEGIAVHLWDLPRETQDALKAKRAEADAEGWRWILGHPTPPGNAEGIRDNRREN